MIYSIYGLDSFINTVEETFLKFFCRFETFVLDLRKNKRGLLLSFLLYQLLIGTQLNYFPSFLRHSN